MDSVTYPGFLTNGNFNIEVLMQFMSSAGSELTEEDYGRGKQEECAFFDHRFKTPGLRNVALTWPYYHDGTRTTLDEAVRDMAIYQCDVEPSQSDVSDMVDFLSSLTGEYQGKVLTNVNTR